MECTEDLNDVIYEKRSPEQDNSSIALSQPNNQRPFKNDGTNYVIPIVKTISIQPAQSNKIDNICWSSSKRSTSMGSTFEDSDQSLNDLMAKPVSNVQEPFNVDEMETQVGKALLYTFPSRHCLETPMPTQVTCKENVLAKINVEHLNSEDLPSQTLFYDFPGKKELKMNNCENCHAVTHDICILPETFTDEQRTKNTNLNINTDKDDEIEPCSVGDNLELKRIRLDGNSSEIKTPLTDKKCCDQKVCNLAARPIEKKISSLNVIEIDLPNCKEIKSSLTLNSKTIATEFMESSSESESENESQELTPIVFRKKKKATVDAKIDLTKKFIDSLPVRVITRFRKPTIKLQGVEGKANKLIPNILKPRHLIESENDMNQEIICENISRLKSFINKKKYSNGVEILKDSNCNTEKHEAKHNNKRYKKPTLKVDDHQVEKVSMSKSSRRKALPYKVIKSVNVIVASSKRSTRSTRKGLTSDKSVNIKSVSLPLSQPKIQKSFKNDSNNFVKPAVKTISIQPRNKSKYSKVVEIMKVNNCNTKKHDSKQKNKKSKNTAKVDDFQVEKFSISKSIRYKPMLHKVTKSVNVTIEPSRRSTRGTRKRQTSDKALEIKSVSLNNDKDRKEESKSNERRSRRYIQKEENKRHSLSVVKGIHRSSRLISYKEKKENNFLLKKSQLPGNRILLSPVVLLHRITIPPKKSTPVKSVALEESTMYSILSDSGPDTPKNLKRPACLSLSGPNPKRTRSTVSSNISRVQAAPARSLKTQHVFFKAQLSSNAVKTKIKELGGKIAKDVTTCTVLLTMRIKRSFEVLCAVGLGKPIVGPSWVQACVASNMIVDPWPYLIKDQAAEDRFKFNLRQTLVGKRNFLKGYNVSSTASVRPLKHIVECSGGTWREKGPKWLCVSCSADKALWPALRRRGATVVSTELILGGVFRQKLDIAGNKLG